MAQNVKTFGSLAIASCKTVDGLAIASAKTIMGVDNTSGGGFDPNSVAGILGWWDSRFDVDEAVGDPAENGDPVQFWLDQSVNGNDASQVLLGNRPVFISSFQNGQPGVDFEANNSHWLVTTASAAQKPFSLFAVVKPESLGNYNAIAGCSVFGGMELRINPSGNLELMHEGNAVLGTSTSALSSGTTYVIGVTYSGSGAYKFWINGSASGTGTNNDTFSASSLVLGGSLGASEFLDGVLAALAFYDNDVGDANSGLINDYFNAVFAVY